MLYFFRLLLLLINIDQQSIFNWFSIKNIDSYNFLDKNTSVSTLDVDYTGPISIKTFNLIIEELWQKVQSGLTLADIENLLFFIIFFRFLILAIRYNLKTSFYITCIGVFAGYLWYRHLIDLISMYRSILVKLPYLHKLGVDAIQLRAINREVVMTDLKLGENIHWYDPGKLIYYSFIKGITHTDLNTGLRYYIDPISMIITKLSESDQVKITPIYYKIYNQLIPQAFEAVGKFWNQLSGIAAYAVITRIGKRYCPYLVRWHWTFLLIIGFIEQILVYFVYRISYFQSAILIPQMQTVNTTIDQNLILQVNFLNGLITFIISIHLGLIFFGLFHAIWGQYFYFPFLVENTELHIGPRPKNSIYSGGKTAWQDEKDKNIQRIVPKFWYGWFGRGTKNNINIFTLVHRFVRTIFSSIR